MDIFERKKWCRLVTITGCCLIQLTLGNMFTAGNLSPYIMSYLKMRVDSNVDDSSAVWITSVAVTTLGLPMFLGGYMERTLGARFTCLCGGIVFCGSIALGYFAIQRSFLAFLFTYAFSSFCGASLSYVTTVATAMKCYPRKKSLASGVVLSFYGLGPLVLNQIQTALINPQNLQVDSKTGHFLNDELLDAVPPAFLYLGLIYGCIQVIGIGLLRVPGQEVQDTSQEQVFTIAMNPVGSVKHTNSTTTNVPQDSCQELSPSPTESSRDFTPLQMARRKEFYIFWLTFALLVQSVLFVNSYYKFYGQKFVDDEFITALGSGAALLNFLGRILWGYFMDKFSYKTCMLVISASGSALVSTFFITGPVGKAFFSVWVLLLFFLIAGMNSLIPVAVTIAFGRTYGSVNFGVIFTSPAVMSLCGALLISYLLQTISWMGTCCVLGAFNLIAFVITLFLPFDLGTIRSSK